MDAARQLQAMVVMVVQGSVRVGCVTVNTGYRCSMQFRMVPAPLRRFILNTLERSLLERMYLGISIRRTEF